MTGNVRCFSLSYVPAFDRIERAENCLRMERGETADNREGSAAVDRSFEAISDKTENFHFSLHLCMMFTNRNMAKMEESFMPLETMLDLNHLVYSCFSRYKK